MWEPLNRWICEAYSLSPIYSYSSCSMGRGWNVKYRSGGKALCTLYPAAGAFTCLVVAPAQAGGPSPHPLGVYPGLLAGGQAHGLRAVAVPGGGLPGGCGGHQDPADVEAPAGKNRTGIACPCFLWYNSGKAALTLAFQPFCRPLRGSRKTYHNYTIPLMLPGIRTKSAA